LRERRLVAATSLTRVLRLASRQHGVVSRSQTRELALSRNAARRAVEVGVLEPIHRQVFRVSGSAPTWHQDLLAAVFAGGPRAVVSHRSAAALYRLDGFSAGLVEITVPHGIGSYVAPRGVRVVVHHTSILPDVDRTTAGVIPTMTPARMFVSLGAVVDDDTLVRALDAAERNGIVDRTTVNRRLTQIRQSGRNGVRAIAGILEGRAALAELPWSVLERTFRDAVEAAGLPQPTGQYPFRRRGRRKAFLDFAWAAYKLAVEADGNIAHALPAQRKSDYARDRDVQYESWRILHFTYEEIMFETPMVMADIRRHLRSLGAAA
jgi:hypothetical protein